MGLPHASAGEVVDLNDAKVMTTRTRVLFKSARAEVIRMVLPAGKTIAEHRAPGEIIVQCLEGQVNFVTMGKTIPLCPGQMFYLQAAEPHAVQAVEDCCFLLTILS